MPIQAELKVVVAYFLGVIISFVCIKHLSFYHRIELHANSFPGSQSRITTFNDRLSLHSTFDPAAINNDGRFIPGGIMATNLFHNGTHFVIFQDTNAMKVKVYDMIKEDEKYPFVILPTNQTPSNYETFKNISLIFLGNEDKQIGYLGHYFHYIEHLTILWAIFQVNMKALYPGRDNFHEWVEHVVIGPNCTRNKWLRKGYTINEFILKAALPKATIYTEELTKTWVKFERAFISERKAGYADPDLHKMSTAFTRWAQEHDPLTFEGFKQLVVNAATTNITYQPKFVSNKKLEVMLISRQGGTRSIHNGSNTVLMNMLENEMKDIIDLKIRKMEMYSPEEQIQISSTADIMIGVHGNGLTNALWMPRGGLVMELFGPGRCAFDYQWISSVSGQKYAGISGDLAMPIYTNVGKQPCRDFMRSGRIGQSFDVNVSVIQQVLSRYVSRGNVGFAHCTYTLRD